MVFLKGYLGHSQFSKFKKVFRDFCLHIFSEFVYKEKLFL